jgi:uncharacterized membrane protein
MTEQTSPSQDTRLAESTRVEAFSDGVFAIVITLLVIEIHRPRVGPGELGGALMHLWPSYAAYVLAFLYVGVCWLNHHRLFQDVAKVDLKFNWINLGILGTTALIPFPTGVLAEAYQSGSLADQRAAVVLYGAVAGLMSAAWLPVFPYLARHSELLETEAAAGYFAKQYSRPIIGVVAYFAAAAAGWFVHPLIGVAIFVLMVVYHAWTSEGAQGLLAKARRRSG